MIRARTQPYEPLTDLEDRWTDWTVEGAFATGAHQETIDIQNRTVTMDLALWHADRDRCIAHAVAHLDLHLPHVAGDPELMCAEADTLADIRLDRP